MRNNEGITLTSLVITMIVLTILTTITVNISQEEIKQARKISELRKIPLHIYKMEFSDNDASNVIKLIYGE